MQEENTIKHRAVIQYEGLGKAHRADFITAEEMLDAKRGLFSVTLTASKCVPDHWFPPSVEGRRVLCLAGEGGLQAHLLAAARAQVSIYSSSDNRLERDRKLAEREGLDISAILGDFTNLSVFPKEYFDIIFCPASVPYIPEVRQVFRECGRVLKPGGVLMLGISLPSTTEDEGLLHGQYPKVCSNDYCHTLEELIGGQIEAGLVIIGFYEDTDEEAICEYFPHYFATRALKI